MNLIDINSIPYSKREKTFVKLTMNYGYDENGNFGKNKIGEVSVIDNGDYLEHEYQTDYISKAEEIAIDKAEKLGLNFIYVSNA